MIVRIDNVMKLEKVLLQIEDEYKFKLDLGELLTLKELLSEISRITEIFFDVQLEYYRKYKDDELLEKYQEKLLNDKIEFNVKKYMSFINKIEERLRINIAN